MALYPYPYPYQAIGALIGAASVDDGRRTGRGLRLLQETLARGAVEPSAGTFLAALRGCTRYPDRWQEAMQVLLLLLLRCRLLLLRGCTRYPDRHDGGMDPIPSHPVLR